MSDMFNSKNNKKRKKVQSKIKQNKEERLQNNPSLEKALSNKKDRRNKKTKKISYWMQTKLAFVFLAIIAVSIVLIARIVLINYKDGDKYTKSALSQQTYTSSVIPYRRGDIVDCNGNVLATSVKRYKLVIDPRYILTKTDGEYVYKEDAVNVLTGFFDLSKEEVEDILDANSSKAYLAMPNCEKLGVEEKKEYDKYLKKYQDENNTSVKGIILELEYERIYPMDTVASTVLGFVYDGNQGSWGIEGYYNSQLNGTEGLELGYFDSELELQRKIKNPKDGNTIVSTIDSNIQRIIQENIEIFNKEIGSSNTAVVAMDPNTGEILGMAYSKGIYNPNKPTDLTYQYTKEEIDNLEADEDKTKITDAYNKMWRNFCISDTFEPGSTYKPFIVAGGLQESVLVGSEKYLCDGRQVVVEGTKPIRCANRSGHGHINLEQAVMYSCNDALMQIGAGMGRDMVSKYQHVFCFGEKTGVDATGEANGITREAEQLNPVELATTSFGQGVNVTMIQMVSAFSSVINGGYYYEPHFVKQVLNSNGAVVENVEPTVVKRTVSKDVSETMKKYLYATVEDGTAKYAQVEGYTIGGKTGTAQKYTKDEEGKTVRDDVNYLVSFIGFAPADNPEVVLYVIVDEPKVEKQSNSKYAQELAADIFADILPFLGVYPSKDATPNYYNPDDYDNAMSENPDSENTDGENSDGENPDANKPDGENAGTDDSGNADNGNQGGENTGTGEGTGNTEDGPTSNLPTDEDLLDYNVIDDDVEDIVDEETQMQETPQQESPQ